MASGRSDYLTKQAGEYIVAAELSRRGFVATTFTGNVPSYDIVAVDAGGTLSRSELSRPSRCRRRAARRRVNREHQDSAARSNRNVSFLSAAGSSSLASSPQTL
jgi:hypothetical protein